MNASALGGSTPFFLPFAGASSPELLQVIHENQDDFIAMMNEPVEDAPRGGATGTAAPLGGAGAGA